MNSSKSSKSAKTTESRMTRAHTWTEQHETLIVLIGAILVITLIIGARSAFLTYSAYCGRENAKTYAAQNTQRTFISAKYWMFQGRVELFEANQTDGQGLSIPVNTEFGSKVSGEFINAWFYPGKAPTLTFPITVKITYDQTPQNIWTEKTNTHENLEGAYLRFQLASSPPSVDSDASQQN